MRAGLVAVFVGLFLVPIGFDAPADEQEAVTLPRQQRPEWLRRDGLVMAGNWEPLFFRVRRGARGNTPAELAVPAGYKGYTPTEAQRNAYLAEHSPEMIARLKELGVNFAMIHGYKGAGLAAERQSMAEAAEFAQRYREAGMRVGIYVDSATFFPELLLPEVPQAEQWALRDADGKPQTYGGSASYRWRLNRNHPEAHAYILEVLRAAIRDIQPDLIHFDNYLKGPAWDANSVERFRDYLRTTFTDEELKAAGITDLANVQPPDNRADGLLRRAWLEFTCWSLADSYRARTVFARSLRPDILMECNPHSVMPAINPPVDHLRLIAGGEAFWDEGRWTAHSPGKLHTRIRSYKVARLMENMCFAYNTTPLELAEAMAFNLDCLGCVCYYEYGYIRNRPWVSEGVLPESQPYIRFFHQRRELLRDADVVADVAVLRSFPSQVFGGRSCADLTGRVEQLLIENRVPFQIIGRQHLSDLRRWPALVLAGCAAMSDRDAAAIRKYVEAGGKACIIGPAATHDEWMRPRSRAALEDLPPAQLVRVDEKADLLEAMLRTCEGATLRMPGAPEGLCAELTDQPGRRLVHIVNYRGEPLSEVAVELRLPLACKAVRVRLAGPDHSEDAELPFQAEEGAVKFRVPKLDVYEIAVVEVK